MLDVGSVKGSIVVGDEFSATFAAFDSKLSKLQADFDALSAKVKDYSSKTKTEVDKVKDSYNKLAASLDPVIAGEQKLEKAHSTLSAALSKGLISQQQHNDLLEKAKAKYSDLQNPLETLKSKVGELSSAIAQFGGEAGEGLAKVAEGILGFGEAGASAVASLGPFLGVAAALAVVLGTLSVGIKAFDWLKDVIKEGMQTEDIIDKLNVTLKTNGSVSGESAAQQVKMAESLALLTGRDKEQIIAAETTLDRFDKLKESYSDVRRLTLDLAEAKKIDADAAANILGPAYEGNAKSITKLKDIGVVLSTGQKKTLQDMVELGNVTGYQTKLTEILTEKLGPLAEAHGKTLAGAIQNSKTAYKEFKESIASEIIPILESVAASVIDSSGGWSRVVDIVKKAGHEIGDDIRLMVGEIALSFHEWRIEQNLLEADLASFNKRIIDAIVGTTAKVAIAFRNLPSELGGGDDGIWGKAANSLKTYQITSDVAFGQIEADARQAAKTHLNAYISIVDDLAKHKQALEGDEDATKSNGSAIDSIAGKHKALKEVLVDTEKTIRSVTDAMNANLLKSSEAADNESRLMSAAIEGTKVYEAMKITIAEETAERQRQAEVTKELEQIRNGEMEAIKKLDAEYKAGKITLTDYTKQKTDLIQRDFELTTQVRASSVEIEKNAISIGVNKAASTSLIGAWKDLRTQSSDIVKGIGEAELAFRDLQNTLSKSLQTKQAKFDDWQSQAQFAELYGKDLESIYQKYGLLSKAEDDLRLKEELRIRIEDAKRKNPLLSQDDIDRITQIVKANDDAIKAIQKSWASLDIDKWVNQPILDGVEKWKQAGIDAFNSWLETGKFDSESFKKSFLDITIKMIEEWLKRWLEAIAARNAADSASNASLSGGSGGRSGGLSSLFSSSGASSWGATAGYAFLAYVGVNIIQGWIGAGQHTSGGRAALGGGDSILTGGGDLGLAAQAQAALQTLITQIHDLSTQWHLGLTQLTADSVSIEQRSDGAIIVRTILDSYGKIFTDMAAALDYAKVEALKFASYSASTDALIQAAIRDSREVTTTGLQGDIDFATRLVTQNLPQIAQQMRTFLQTFVDDFHHAMDLFGQLGFRGSGDLSQLSTATSSVITQFSNSLQSLYDQLTGHKEDARQLAEDQRIAYNAQRAIIIAQITLLYQETQARVAEIEAMILRGTVVAGGGGGVASGGQDNPNGSGESDPFAPAGFGKGGGPLQLPDARNPTSNPQLAALLQVLDNLARAIQGLPPEIAPGGIKLPRSGGGSGSQRQSNEQSVRDAITASRLKLAGDEYFIQLSQLNNAWDAEAKKAGKNKELLAEITTQRQAEITALRQQTALKVTNDIAAFASTGNNSFAEQLAGFNKTAADLATEARKTGQDLHQSSRVIAGELQAIADANKKHAVDLAQSAVASLNLPVESTISDLTTLTGTIDFLGTSIYSGALSVQQFTRVWGELIDQSKLTLFTLAESIANSTGDATKAAEIKAKMDQINFEIQREQFNILLTQYEALNLISGKDEDYLEGLRTWLNGLNPDFAAINAANNTSAITQTASTLAAVGTTFQAAVAQFKQATDSLLQSFNSLFGSTDQLGGSAQDRLAVAQQQFKVIEQGALAGDVTARGQYGTAAQNYLAVLSEANAGGALFGAERDRLRAEFQTLLAQTRFTLDGVTYDSRLGAPIAPVSAGVGQPDVSGYTGPITAPSSTTGGLSSDVTGVLQQILTALLTGNANTTPALNSISNNTAGATASTQTVNANLDRLIAAVYQWLNAARPAA